MNSLTEIKNSYAQEQGYEDWNEIREEFREKAITFTEMTGHENAWCIRAQKAALEKAAGKAKIIKTGNSGSYFDASVYRASITSPENLIR